MAAQRHMRLKAQLPPCYHEGYLTKRPLKEKISRRLWTCLCGNTLFFFSTSKDSNYAEKLELSGFVSVTDDGIHSAKPDAARFSLRMKDGEYIFTAPSLEARELWKGFIYSVAKLEVPSSLNLLPGQVHMLREVIDREKERCKPPPPLPAPIPALYVPVHADMPSCYYRLSRTEAENLLERHKENGNFLLRPGKTGITLAITTYQDLNGPVFRHYRVTRQPDGGFAIDVENPILCATLHDAVDYMIEMTDGILRPLILEDIYDNNITYVQPNDENGEKNILSASIGPKGTTTPTPNPGRLTAREESLDMESTFEGILYINDPHHATDKSSARSVTPPPNLVKKAVVPRSFPASSFPESLGSGLPRTAEKSTAAAAPTPPTKPVKKALLPKSSSFQSLSLPGEQNSSTSADMRDFRRPVPAPRSNRSSEHPIKERRASSLTDDHLSALSQELKEKLERRRAKE